jgi:hypothetical protein
MTRADENLVSDDYGSSRTMNSSTSIRTREQIQLAEILRRCDSILQTLSTCNSGIEPAGGGGRCTNRDLAGDGDNSVVRKVSTSPNTAVARRSCIIIGP